VYDWSKTIEEMRRAALQRYQRPAELLQIRKRMGSARGHFFRTVIEHLACETKVDLRPFYEDARRRNRARHQDVIQLIDELEAKVAEQALVERTRLASLREEYLRDFPRPYELPPGRVELKFNIPIYFVGTAIPAECMTVFGGGFGEPNFVAQASAEIRATPGQPGMQFFPRIYTDNQDCETSTIALAFYDVFFRTVPIERTFLATSVRIDLFGVGIASAQWGDLGWGFDESSDNTAFVDLSVEIGQLVRGAAQHVSILDKNLFRLGSETVQSIRILLSLEDSPTNLVVRGRDYGGGEIGCYVLLRTSARVKGAEDGRVRLDFSAPNYGLTLTGISLIGEYLPPPPL
jgi:hypothetical protein